MEGRQLLAEIEDAVRTMPSEAAMRNAAVETLPWFGRISALLENWKKGTGDDARVLIKTMHGPSAARSDRALTQLLVLLHSARSELQLAFGYTSVAVGEGLVFDYFDEIRKIIELAKTDILFIDPYLDADFVSRYLPHVTTGASIRLLAREKINKLVPAARTFVQQFQVSLEIRSVSRFHDRYIIVDGTSLYQSGASFKDGAKAAPTTITQITDAFEAVRQTYEDLWQRSTLVAL